MQYYQHYSFDLWLTLIKSNPEFKPKRNQIFHRDYNQANKSLDEVAHAFRQVDLMCNAVNECTGKNIDSDEMYLMVISLINDNNINLHHINLPQLNSRMEELIFNYPPVLYSAETNEVLMHLKEKANATLSLLSNTGFIKGATLRSILMGLNLYTYFDFQLYSDEAGLSKPNPAFFKLMVDEVKQANPGKEIDLQKIIHIGDNAKADMEGANAAGIKAFLINSNNIPISSILPC